MRLRNRNQKHLDDDDFDPEVVTKSRSTRRGRKYDDQYGTTEAYEVPHHKADYFEEQRLEQMLDDDDSNEHDNDCGDKTDQEEDKCSEQSSEEEDDDVKPKNSKKEAGPLDHEIEFILGERWPTVEEYQEWLE